MPDDFRGRHIHQVPVVGLFGMLQIECHDFVSLTDGIRVVDEAFCCQSLKLIDEQQPSAKPHFVPMVHQQCGNLAERRVLCCLHHLSCLWHFDAQELVTLAIFAFSCLEKAHQHLSLLFVVQRLHIFYNNVSSMKISYKIIV